MGVNLGDNTSSPMSDITALIGNLKGKAATLQKWIQRGLLADRREERLCQPRDSNETPLTAPRPLAQNPEYQIMYDEYPFFFSSPSDPSFSQEKYKKPEERTFILRRSFKEFVYLISSLTHVKDAGLSRLRYWKREARHLTSLGFDLGVRLKARTSSTLGHSSVPQPISQVLMFHGSLLPSIGDLSSLVICSSQTLFFVFCFEHSVH